MIDYLRQSIKDFYGLFFPRLCLSCLNETIEEGENHFCVKCHFAMPYTDHFERSDNELMMHFYGRLPVTQGCAFLYFTEGGIVQQMLHNFKYRGMKEIGRQLSSIAGNKIHAAGMFRNVDMVLPMPMHYKKYMKRGFNQSEIIAKSLAEEINVPVVKDVLTKEMATTSQTNKSRMQRQDNVKNVFKVKKADLIKGKHILLVDDVVTTGATIESCGNELLKNGASQISVFSLAIAI